MQDDWTERLSCAIQCHRCDEKMDSKDPGIFSVYDHQVIPMCMILAYLLTNLKHPGFSLRALIQIYLT